MKTEGKTEMRALAWRPLCCFACGVACLLYASAGRAQTNTPPTARNDQIVVERDVPTLIDVLANDEDPDGQLLEVVETSQPLGSLENHGDGSFTYVANANVGSTDAFTYTLDDGVANPVPTATVTIVVGSMPSVDIGIEASYVPYASYVDGQGALARTTIRADQYTPTVSFEYFFDPNRGLWQERPGAECPNGLPANPTFVRLKKVGTETIEGCSFQGSWDSVAFKCSLEQKDAFNAGATILLDTNEFNVDVLEVPVPNQPGVMKKVCKEREPFDPRIRFGQEAFFKVDLVVDGVTHRRELYFTKNSDVRYYSPVADASVWSLYPDQNFGTYDELDVAANILDSMVRFEIPGANNPEIENPVVSASLRLEAKLGVENLTVFYLPESQSWTDTEPTWNNHFDLAGEVQMPSLGVSDNWIPGEERHFDLRNTVTRSKSYAYRLVSSSDLLGVFWSRESPDASPKLVVTLDGTLVIVGAPSTDEDPIPNFTVFCSYLFCQFNSNTSEGNISQVAWDFGDGTTLGPTTDRIVEHTYSQGDTYRVTLTVYTDTPGGPAPSASREITIAGQNLCPLQTVWVNFAYAGTEVGTQAQPFNTVAEAIDCVIAGGTIYLNAGTSGEMFSTNKPLSIQAFGGLVHVGQ